MICRRDKSGTFMKAQLRPDTAKINFMTIYIELTNHRDNHLDQQWKQNDNSTIKLL